MIVKFEPLFKEKEWICLNCPVWVWPDSWFNEFTQFEHLIEKRVKKTKIVEI